MGAAYLVSLQGLGAMMLAPAVFAFGLVAFGFLGMGPVTIAVDSYGPVTDNAQSVYELSTIETLPNIKAEIKKDFGFEPEFDRAKDYLEANDGAGNTFKATAKPVLIGTAVVGATTLIFSIILILTEGLTKDMEQLSILHPPFLLGLIIGGAVIYWFTGASTQAVATGAYRAVEFIKHNIRLDAGAKKASVADSKQVVEICTQYAQKGMFNIFLTVFFSTLAFACLEPFFFIGYLISIAIFGLYQAIFMANAGGAWDNAKKIVEVELKEKGTPLHAATVVGDTVGDPFKDTSSVAMNPVIKFTTLFGLLAVELAIEMSRQTTLILAAVFFAASLIFVWRSFYGMRIEVAEAPEAMHAGARKASSRGRVAAVALRSAARPDVELRSRALRASEAAWTLSGAALRGSRDRCLDRPLGEGGHDVGGAVVPAQWRHGDLAALIPVEVGLSLGAAHLVELQPPELLRIGALHLVEAADDELGLTQPRNHDAARSIGGSAWDVDRKSDPLGKSLLEPGVEELGGQVGRHVEHVRATVLTDRDRGEAVRRRLDRRADDADRGRLVPQRRSLVDPRHHGVERVIDAERDQPELHGVDRSALDRIGHGGAGDLHLAGAQHPGRDGLGAAFERAVLVGRHHDHFRRLRQMLDQRGEGARAGAVVVGDQDAALGRLRAGLRCEQRCECRGEYERDRARSDPRHDHAVPRWCRREGGSLSCGAISREARR